MSQQTREKPRCRPRAAFCVPRQAANAQTRACRQEGFTYKLPATLYLEVTHSCIALGVIIQYSAGLQLTYLTTVSCMQQDGDMLLYLQTYRGLVNYKVASRFFYKRVHRFKKHMCASEIHHLYRSYSVSLVSFLSCLRIPVLPSSWLPAERELCNAQLDRHPDQLWDRGQMHTSCFWWSVPALGPRRNKAAALPHQHL